jgi:hypothetical protein
MANAAVKRSAALTEAVEARTQSAARTQATPKTDVREKMQTNTFAKIIFNPELSLQEKQKALEAAFVATGVEEQDRTRLQEYEACKEFLQAQRTAMAEEIIRLTDTKTYSEIKDIIDQMYGGMQEFENQMQPLTDTLDAIYTLRTEGNVTDTFKKIQQDRDTEKKLAAQADELSQDVANQASKLSSINRQNDALRQQKSFFGLGGIKAEAQAKIDENSRLEEEIKKSLQDAKTKIGDIRAQRDTLSQTTGKFAKEEQKLRELLDISSEGHQKRQKDLIDSAMKYVTTAKERTGSVRDHLGAMNGQIENLADANGNMTQIYALFSDAIKGANKTNQTKLEELKVPEGEESLVEKMTRENRTKTLNDHIKTLGTAEADTTVTYADLTSQTIRIKSMKDSNDDQLDQIRTLNARGVAGVADRLATALQAVNAAAINQAAGLARDSMQEMSDRTNSLSQKEVIRTAMGLGDKASEISKAIESLAQYGDTLKSSTIITRDSLKEIREQLASAEKTAADVQKDIRESQSVYSEKDGTLSTGDTAPAKKSGLDFTGFKV